jgi:branched-chain amino acid transport system permease protein
MMWFDQILQGVFLGGYYALLACGLSFMFGVLRIVNLAHGSIAVLAAYLVWSIAEQFHISPFVALAISLPIMGLAGWLLQRTILERSLRSGSLTPLLSTFGLAVVIDNSLFQKFGADTHSLDIGDLAYNSWNLTPDITIGQLALLTLVVAVALLGGLQLFLNRTPLGRAIRATAEDPDTAELVGIDSRAVYAAAAA